MQIRLSDHFTLGRLLRFTLPSVIMMVVASLYSVFCISVYYETLSCNNAVSCL